MAHMNEVARQNSSSGSWGERQLLVHVSPELADIVTSLLLALFPDRQLYREVVGSEPHGPSSLAMAPGIDAAGYEKLKRYIYQLSDRAEWSARNALAREVNDRSGTYLELIVPIAPEAYAGGPALVGPFAEEAAADEFGSLHSGPTLSHDTYPTAGGWLADLFEIPAPGWESGLR